MYTTNMLQQALILYECMNEYYAEPHLTISYSSHLSPSGLYIIEFEMGKGNKEENERKKKKILGKQNTVLLI